MPITITELNTHTHTCIIYDALYRNNIPMDTVLLHSTETQALAPCYHCTLDENTCTGLYYTL